MPHAVARGRHAVTGAPAPASRRAPRGATGGGRAAAGCGGSIRGRRSARRALFAAAAVWLAAAAPLGGQGSHAQVYLTVIDRGGAPVLDLQPSDVLVWENGVPGEVTHLVRPRAPADVSLLVDTSRDFVSATHHLRRALTTFVDRLAGSARTSLITFGDGARNVVAPTLRTAPLREAIDLLFPSPGFGGRFHDGVTEAARNVVERRPRRPVIVAVTSSAASLQPSDRYVRDFLNPLVSVGAPVHVVVLRQRPGDLLGGLSEIAARTAGRFEVVTHYTRLEEPLAAVADEILGQYVLTYVRPELPGDADVTLAFRVAREDVTIRVAPVL